MRNLALVWVLAACLLGCGGKDKAAPAADTVDTAAVVADTVAAASDTAAISPSDVSSNPDSIAMVFVEGMTFAKRLGGNTVPDFYMSKYEVTQGLWMAVMGNDTCYDYDNPSYFQGDDNLPFDDYSYDDIEWFIYKLNQMTGKKYRLPTYNEWKYAARGGNKSKGYKYSGSNNIDDVAWYGENSGKRTHPVGTKMANELGLHDMSGNVREAERTPYGEAVGGSSVGGSWGSNAKGCIINDGSDGNSYYGLGIGDDKYYGHGSCGLRLFHAANFPDLKKPANLKEYESKPADLKNDVSKASISTFTDKRDGKVYKIVKIGSQTWFAENLNYDAKGNVCYDNKNTNCAKYGRLYNWETALKACPADTHLPTAAEWDILTDYVGGWRMAGEKLQSTSDCFRGGTDNYGFSALLGGGYNNGFYSAGHCGYWWSATEDDAGYALNRDMCYYSSVIGGSYDKTLLFSVRCILDDEKERRK